MRHHATIFHSSNAVIRGKNIQCIAIGGGSEWFCKEMGLSFDSENPTKPIIFNYQVNCIKESGSVSDTQLRTPSQQANFNADYTWFALLPRNAKEAKQLARTLHDLLQTSHSAITASKRGIMRYDVMEQTSSNTSSSTGTPYDDFSNHYGSGVRVEAGKELTREHIHQFANYFKKTLNEHVEEVQEGMHTEVRQDCCTIM